MFKQLTPVYQNINTNFTFNVKLLRGDPKAISNTPVLLHGCILVIFLSLL